MKKLLLNLTILLVSTHMFSQVTILESGGWMESMSVNWSPVENAESYNVYYSGEGITDEKIDDQLIRNYDTYFRADVLGIAAGTYTIKIIPVIDGSEGTSATTETITVTSYDRTGFAFSNGRVPGAYKSDGTPKDNAVILYITQNTKNTISLDVTGANANPCVGLETILEGFKKGNDNRPLIVRLVGQITDLDYMNKGDIVIENNNNALSYITLEGVGEDAVADGWGIRVKNAANIEIRNIATMNVDSNEGDNIGLQQNNEYIWIHNCDFFYGGAGGDSDQAKGDGALDCKKSTYVTFSYNHFWDAGKCNLLGLSEGTTEGLFITFHHNWYDHSDSRHPRVRYYSAHVYNNYYDGNSKYGVGSTLGSSVFVEGNYFRNCRFPILTSMQGSDVYDSSSGTNDYSDNPTFSKEDGGTIKAYNNYMTGQERFVAYNDSDYPNPTVDFDAYVASSRDETILSTVVSSYGANTYNNFDTNASIMYDYVVESPEDAKASTMQLAGRFNGGDFQWTFNNAVDDTSYAVDPALKSALTSYQTSLVAVQGDGESSGGGEEEEEEEDPVIEGDVVHNFTLSGMSSSYFTIVGNLSDSKGTVNYGGLTLTQCLKIESSTSITFTTTEDATLTMVFNSDFSNRIKVDGVAHYVTAGVFSIELTAGTHVLTKSDTGNLYYMSIQLNAVASVEDDILSEMILYPNPVESNLNIKADIQLKKVEIYNMLGVLVKSVSINLNSIAIDDLSQGVYLVKVYSDTGVAQRMIMRK